MTLARTPYARLSPADIGQVDRELKKLEQMSAGLFVPKTIVAARSPYTVQGTDTMLLCDCTAGPVTLTFPLAARVDGMQVQVVKSDTSANAVTLSGTFSGVVSPTLTVPDSGFTVVAMNGSYHVTAFAPYPIVTGESGVVSFVYPYGDVRRYGATGVAGTNARAAFAAADTAAVAGYGSNKAVRVPAGTHRFATNITIASAVVFEPGAILKPDSGVTVTLNGAIITSLLGQIFDTSAGGTIVVARTAAPRFYPQWWGGTPGVGDATVAYNAVVANIKTNGGGTIESTTGPWSVSSPINIIETRDLKWIGAGRFSTVITQTTANQPVVQCNGLWYSEFEGLQFRSTGVSATTGAFELDGNYDGTHTLSVQGNTFKDCLTDANGSLYAFAVGRRGGSAAQCSENYFLNCHFSNSTFANYYQNGFNALQNTFVGGNHQGHQKHGIYLLAGQCVVVSVGFQSQFAYQQILNDGYDINCNSSGVNDRIVVIGCRTESARFYRGGSSQPPVLIGNYQNYGGDVGWAAGGTYTLNQSAIHTSVTLGPQLYVVTTAGTTGGVQPTWPDSGTVADGSVVWTMVTVYPIDIANGAAIGDNGMQFGFMRNTGQDYMAKSHETNTDYTANSTDRLILVDATSGARTITLPTTNKGGGTGHRVVVQKGDTTSNTVTVKSDDTSTIATIPGGARGSVDVVYQGGAILAAAYRAVAKDFADPTFRRPFFTSGGNVAAGDFVLSAGFGTTASISAVSGKDARGQVTISSSGTGQAANPTVTFTYHDGTWTSQVYVVTSRAGGSQRSVQFEVTTITATQVVLTFLGTPVAGETYTVAWIAEG